MHFILLEFAKICNKNIIKYTYNRFTNNFQVIVIENTYIKIPI